MSRAPLIHTSDDGRRLEAVVSLRALTSLGASERSALESLGVATVGELLHHQPIHDARLLMAVADGVIAHTLDIDRMLDPSAAGARGADLRTLPVGDLRRVDDAAGRTWREELGIATVGELAEFGPAREAEGFIAAGDFREEPSAPPELIPRATGSIANRSRYTSFVREDRVDLARANLQLFVDQDRLRTVDPRLLALFQTDPRPILELGYDVELIQEWVNLGTHLGEPVKSIGLMPGETRRIAIVDWESRVAAQRRENTDVAERLDHELVHQRALDEVTRATAAEQQAGGSSIEAGTTATAFGGVAGQAVAGAAAVGIPAALVGAAVGAAVGTAVPGIGNLAGADGGTVIGLAAGAVVGGIGGALTATGNSQLGQIESDTSGQRALLTDFAQRVNDVTSQKSSSVRSLWSTVVLTEEQAESERVQTVAIANYNHAHALTLQYFEVLQHYRVQSRIGRHEPLLFLPFSPIEFDIPLVQAYWSVLREGVTDARLRLRYDRVVEDVDPVRDAPLPDTPAKRGALRVRALRVRVTGEAILGAELLAGGERTALRREAFDLFTASFGEDDAPRVADVRRLQVTPLGGGFGVGVGVGGGAFDVQAEIEDDEAHRWSVSARATAGGSSFGVPLDLAAAVERLAADPDAASSLSELQALVDRINQRRYFFTRLLLLGMEPEQLADLVGSLIVGRPGGPSRPLRDVGRELTIATRIPDALRDARAITLPSGVAVSALADPQPLAITGNTLVFRLRSQQPAIPAALGALASIGDYLKELQAAMAGQRNAPPAGDSVFLPTKGVFAEAVLGVSIAAEKLDGTRHINWHELPIPHVATDIAPLTTGSRRAEVDGLDPTVPESDLDIQQPTPLPDPATVAGTLAALNNPQLFRDLSGAATLAGVLDRLAGLAEAMANQAGTLAGAAQSAAVQQAGQLAGKVADASADLIKQESAARQKADAPQTATEKGVAANAIERLAKEGIDGGGLSEVERAAAAAFGVEVPAEGFDPGPPTLDDLESALRSGDGLAGTLFQRFAETPERSDFLASPTSIRKALPEGLRAVPEAFLDAGQRIADAGGEPAAVRSILTDLFNATVLPRLQAANSNPAALDDALRAFVNLVEADQLTGGELPGPLLEQARALTGSALRKGLEEANDRLGQGELPALRRLDDLLEAAGLLGLDEAADTAGLLADLNASLRITSLTASAPTVSAAGSVDVTVQTETRVGGQVRQERANVLLTAVDASESFVQGETDQAGRFTRSLALSDGATDLVVGTTATSNLSPLLADSAQLTVPGEVVLAFEGAIVLSDPDGDEVGPPLPLRAGDGAQLNVLARRGRGPLNGVVRFALSGRGSLSALSSRTEPDGRASVEYRAPATGTGVALVAVGVAGSPGAARFDIQFSDGN